MKTFLQRLNLKTNKLKVALATLTIGISAHAQVASIIKDVNTGAANSSPSLFTFCGGLNCIFFVADNGTTGQELWKYDISGNTSALVKDINPGATGSGITNITSNMAGNGILFGATDGVNGNELWKSDGTAAGTSMVVDINTGAGNSNPSNFFAYGGSFIMSADNGTNGKEPWLTNGTPGGTAMLKDINPGVNASDPNGFTPVAGKLVFRANNGTNGSELWITDMTSGGTVLLKDINVGAGSSVPLNFCMLGSNVLFSAMDGTVGAEVWKTDGTPGGTTLVKDINSGAGNSINMSPGAKAFFTAYNSNVYFQATDGSTGYELWKSDGTSGGTTLVKDIQSGSASSTPSGIIADMVNIYFVANDGTTGMELWTSDGTTGGTTLLKDINPGASSSTSTVTTFVTMTSGGVYFAANDGVNGTELWRTLGSSATTLMMADINPGAANATPNYLLATSNNIYFSATDGTTGIEPWRFDPLAAGIKDVTIENSSFSMYPNPCHSTLNIQSSENDFLVKIYSVTGGLVFIQKFDSNSAMLDVSGLEAGSYLIRVSNSQGQAIKKLIITN
jgi:ELWxxDGT repeat protein